MNIFKNVAIRKQLISGFALMGVLITIIVLLNIWQMSRIKALTERIIQVRIPTKIASGNMLKGMNRALSDLWGWMLLGEESFKEDRAKAWSDEIYASRDAMRKLSEHWNPQDKERLRKIESLLERFAQYQKEIEEIAHTQNNIPALKILLEQAAPQAAIMGEKITAMIDLEANEPSTPARKALLGMMADVRGTLGLGLANIRAFLLSGDVKFQENYEKLWAKNERRFNDLKRNQSLLTSEQLQAYRTFAEARLLFDPLPPTMLKMRAQPDWNLANYWLGTKASPTGGEILEILSQMDMDQKELLSTDGELINAEMNQLLTLEWVVLVLGILIATVLGFMIFRSIIQPLNGISEYANEMAKGNANIRVDVERNDEIGNLANAFRDILKSLRAKIHVSQQISAGNLVVQPSLSSEVDILGMSQKAMIGSLNEVLHQVADSANQLMIGSQQVSESSLTISQGATEQSSALEEISSSMEEMSTQTDSNAGNASQANQLAISARQQAEEGNEQMGKMLQSMEEINESSENISNIIKTIDEIAFQTNVLAINAAVEAARAGVHGKGFAVVAEEVRSLAQRSAAAAKETTVMIKDSVKKIDQGVKIADETAASLKEIMIGSTKVTDLVNEIAAASTEQARGAQEINQGLSQLNQVTQQNANVAENASSSATQLRSQSEHLKSIVTRFKLKEGPLTRQPMPPVYQPENSAFPALAQESEVPSEPVESMSPMGAQSDSAGEDLISFDQEDIGKF